MAIKAVIIDFFGVLFSNFDWQVIDERIKPDRQKWQRFQELKQLSNQGKITNRYLQTAVADLADDASHPDRPAVYPKPYFNMPLIRFLTSLEPKPKIGLLSNGNRRDVIEQLRLNGALKYLDAIQTSSDSRFEKPQRGAYEQMFAALGCAPEETVIVDDSQTHTNKTTEYGFKSIHYFEEIDFEAELDRFIKS